MPTRRLVRCAGIGAIVRGRGWGGSWWSDDMNLLKKATEHIIRPRQQLSDHSITRVSYTCPDQVHVGVILHRGPYVQTAHTATALFAQIRERRWAAGRDGRIARCPRNQWRKLHSSLLHLHVFNHANCAICLTIPSAAQWQRDNVIVQRTGACGPQEILGDLHSLIYFWLRNNCKTGLRGPCCRTRCG